MYARRLYVRRFVFERQPRRCVVVVVLLLLLMFVLVYMVHDWKTNIIYFDGILLKR